MQYLTLYRIPCRHPIQYPFPVQIGLCSISSPGRCPIPFPNYLPSIKAVVDFANAIPGFSCLPQQDRVTLLKACVLDVLLIAGCSRDAPTLSASPLLAHSLANLSSQLRSNPATPFLAAIAVCGSTPAPSPLVSFQNFLEFEIRKFHKKGIFPLLRYKLHRTD